MESLWAAWNDVGGLIAKHDLSPELLIAIVAALVVGATSAGFGVYLRKGRSPHSPNPLIDTINPKILKDVQGEKYDVFLSHSGEQKREVVGHLYEELVGRGLRVFVDYADLPRDFPGHPNDQVMLAAAATATVGLFVVSKSFLERKWTLRELDIFHNRRIWGEEDVRLLPFFYWNGGFKKEWDGFDQAKRKAAEEHFDKASGFNGICKFEGDFDIDLIKKIASAAVTAVAQIDLERARKQLTGTPLITSNHFDDSAKPTKSTTLAVDVDLTLVERDLTQQMTELPERLLRHAVYGLSDDAVEHAGQRLAQTVLQASAKPQQDYPRIVWILDARSMATVEGSLSPLARQLRLSHSLKATAIHSNVGRLRMRRLLEVLTRWPSPWLLILSNSGLDVGELDNMLPMPLAELKSTGIILLTATRSADQFHAHYFWKVHNIAADSGVERLRKLLTFFNERYSKDGVEEALSEIRRIHEQHRYPEFIKMYTRMAAEEKATGKPSPWTVARKKLYNFWEEFVRNIEVDHPEALRGYWKYRADEYCRLNEFMDVTNYYRWRLDLQGDNTNGQREYWRRRPDSYVKLCNKLGLHSTVDVDAIKKIVLETIDETAVPETTQQTAKQT